MEKSSYPLKNPRPASTLILAREKSGELQVYLLRRSAQSGFMPGNYVFPGGTVGAEDCVPEFWVPNADMDLRQISRRLGGTLGAEEALGHAVAALRETFEEAGVFLSSEDGPLPEDFVRAAERRTANELPDGWFHDWILSKGWKLGLSRLRRWAHWITPEMTKQRYDTRFFLAFMPPDQECVPDSRETTDGIWIKPTRALEGNLLGEIPLSPPTLVTLHELASFGNIKDLDTETRNRPWGEARLPRAILLPQGPLVLLPWDPLYCETVEVDVPPLDQNTLWSEPFSRLFFSEGIWRPVR